MVEFIVAVFDTENEATAAETDLENAGIPRAAVRRYRPGQSPTISDATAASQTSVSQTSYQSSEYAESHQDRGAASQSGFGAFWAWLTGSDTDTDYVRNHEHASIYEGHLSAGQVIVTVRVENDIDGVEAERILHRHAPADVATRHETGDGTLSSSTMAPGALSSGIVSPGSDTVVSHTVYTDTPATGTSATGAPAMGTRLHDETVSGATVPGATVPGATVPGLAGSGAAEHATTAGTSYTGTSHTGTTAGETTTPVTRETGEEMVLPLASEKIDVGKRVETGTTRVRRYTVETPVSRTVPLHDETTTIERRRPLSGEEAPGPGHFEERTVEVQEKREVPVVDKVAEVTEEVVIGKTSSDRTETVQGTERHEEVEVEDAHKPTTTTGPTGTTDPLTPSHSGTGHTGTGHTGTTDPLTPGRTGTGHTGTTDPLSPGNAGTMRPDD